MFRLPFPISYLDNTNFSHRGHNLEVCKTKLTRRTHTQTHTHIYLGSISSQERSCLLCLNRNLLFDKER